MQATRTLLDAAKATLGRASTARLLHDQLTGGRLPTLEGLRTRIVTRGYTDPPLARPGGSLSVGDLPPALRTDATIQSPFPDCD